MSSLTVKCSKTPSTLSLWDSLKSIDAKVKLKTNRHTVLPP